MDQLDGEHLLSLCPSINTLRICALEEGVFLIVSQFEWHCSWCQDHRRVAQSENDNLFFHQSGCLVDDDTPY